MQQSREKIEFSVGFESIGKGRCPAFDVICLNVFSFEHSQIINHTLCTKTISWYWVL